MSTLSLAIAVTFDISLGDPRWLPHPVRWIGRLITFLESILYPKNRNTQLEVRRGLLLSLIVMCITAGSGFMFLILCKAVSPLVQTIGGAIIGFYCLSARSLAQESGLVLKYLKKNDMAGARKAVSMIVGRDTDTLDEQGIIRATIETVAENITDGIVSPLFYLAIGGPVAALVFKAVSTMDSMIGYNNDRYRNFGTCAARLDDALNFIPARLTGFFLVPVSAMILGFDGRRSFQIIIRDRLKHESPNSAHGEAAVAGALGIQLGGSARYGGIESCKPFLGDSTRSIEPADIQKATYILYGVTALTIVTCVCFLVTVAELSGLPG
jgi:adenosylcobinamide-phosphate synthase